MAKKILADITRCVGCRSCEAACAVAHSEALSLAGALVEGVKSRVLVVNAEGSGVPVQCRHCAEAPCVAVCPKSALTQEGPGEPVLPHPELCTACRSCVTVCPFGAVRLGGAEGKTLIKCDVCLDRLEAGQEPACVEACPTGALVFADAEGCVAEAYAETEAATTGEELPAEPEAAERPAETDAEGKRKPARVACVCCGEEFAPQAMVRSVAKKIGRRPAYLMVCPQCRRTQFAAGLASRLGTCEEVAR